MSSTLEQINLLRNAIKRNLIGIIILAGSAALITFYIVRQVKGTYETYSKIFPLSLNKGGSSSPIDAIKSQFGISDKTDLDKMYNVKELVTSRTISRNIVSQKTNNPKYHNYATWLIKDFNTNVPFWKEKAIINSKKAEDSIFKAASIMVQMTSIENDPKVGFTTIKTSAHEESLCKEINSQILSEISKFYIKFSTEKAQSDLVKIKMLRDSLKDQLYGLETTIAGVQDASRFSVRSTVNIPQARLMRNRIEVEQLYGVASSAFQNARFKLLSESPIFQVLDYPGPPYNFIKPSSIKAAVIAFIVAFIILALLACRKVFWQMIKEELARS